MMDMSTKGLAPRQEMPTVGYRHVGANGESATGVIFREPLKHTVTGEVLPNQQEVVLRKDAEHAIAIESLHVRREALAWQDTAAQMSHNADFWEGLVRRIGKAVSNHDIGVHIADDGKTWNPEPLTLKVVESVEKSYAPGNRFQRALRILITGK